MPLIIINVREHTFPETYCWALQECVTLASRAAGWEADPSAQKVVRLSTAEFKYHPGAKADGSVVDVPNFILIEVLLARPRSAAEKKAFWSELRAGVEARLRTKEPARP